MTRTRARAAGRPIVLVATIGMIAGLVGSASAAHAGFDTARPPMLIAVVPRGWVDPILTVGDTIGGYRFESIPDGIAAQKGKGGATEVYVNHETSTVPFPYFDDPAATPPTAPTAANSQNDFDNAQLSKLILDKNATVVDASMAITSAMGFQRFCSNFLATKENGFDRPLLFTNEEAVDWVNRTVPSWPATEGADNARQSGVVVAVDPKTGEIKPIWGLGRLNHENSVGVPGYGKPVLLTGDDTFVNSPSQSQLYSYIANDANGVWNDTGDLWAFVSDNPARQRYEDFVPGDVVPVTGHFIQVPKLIATGRNPDGSDVMSTDAEAALGVPAGTYAPPTNGSFSRPPGKTTGPSVDGPQWVLERWSQLNGVFRFIRVEDIASDKRHGMSNVVYVVDSGRGTAPATGPTFGPGISTNGRIWKLVLDPNNPTVVTSMSIYIEGDDAAVKDPNEMHQPDNIESTVNGLYFTEDPGGSQQFGFVDVPGQPSTINDPRRTEARIWQHKFSTGANSVVFKVDQSADEGPTDVDTTSRGNLGAWEATGIVDVSKYFGKGTFLVAVQAHSLFIETQNGPDLKAPTGPDWLNKREGGQLLLVHVPGG